jgi:hypothetical protein
MQNTLNQKDQNQLNYTIVKIPCDIETWLNEIAKAYQEAKDTIPYGKLIGENLKEKDLFHIAPQLAIKYRGFQGNAKIEKKAIDAALSSYEGNLDNSGDVLKKPEIAFTFCYFAAHFGMNFMKAEKVDEYMRYIEEHEKECIEQINPGKNKDRRTKKKSGGSNIA